MGERARRGCWTPAGSRACQLRHPALQPHGQPHTEEALPASRMGELGLFPTVSVPGLQASEASRYRDAGPILQGHSSALMHLEQPA